MDDKTPAKTLSLILPMFDLRECGWNPLRSVINQKSEGHDFEIVVVLGRSSDPRFRPPPEMVSLLNQCDHIIQTDLDPEDPEHEILFLLSGLERSRGRFLYFLEGHTTMVPGAAKKILNAIATHPECRLFWCRRRDVAHQPLGRLIAMNTKRHQQRAKREGYFTLGGTSVLCRDLYHQLGGFQTEYGRYNEVIFRYRLHHMSIPVTKINNVLTLHYNDFSRRQLMRLTMAMGSQKFFAYSDSRNNQARFMPPARHFIYRCLDRWGRVELLAPFLKATARLGFFLSTRIYRLHQRTAFWFFFIGLGCSDMAGYCAQFKAMRRQEPSGPAVPEIKFG